MKRMLFTFVMVFVVFVSCRAFADMSSVDLNNKVVLTEGAVLLSQVDAVSLYLTSNRIAYAPRLTVDKKIEVEVTVLSKRLIDNSVQMQSFVLRGIKTFISVLKDRLPTYAPSIAQSFDENEDIIFVVDAGAGRVPVARWYAGKWTWKGAWASTAPVKNTSESAISSETSVGASKVKRKKHHKPRGKGKLGCDCPAMHY